LPGTRPRTKEVQRREEKKHKEWAILELEDHTKLGGSISEIEIGGITFLEIEVYAQGKPVVKQRYHPNAIYCITPTAAEEAKSLIFSADHLVRGQRAGIAYSEDLEEI